MEEVRTSWMPKYVPPASCVLYLLGQDDAQSTAIRDRSGNKNNGAIGGALWKQNSKGLWGLDFDGGTDTVIISTDASLDPVTNGSIEFWFRANTINRNDVESVGDALYYIGAIYFAIFFGATNNAIRVFRYDGTAFHHSGNTAVTTGIFYYVVVTWGVAGIINYLNGASDGGDSTAGIHTGTGRAHNMGNSAARNIGFDGEMYLVRTHNIALSATQVLGHYNQERHLFGV